MRHNVTKKKMSRTSAHRKSLQQNLACELIIHEKVSTTLEKAKFVKPYVEKVITLSKRSLSAKDDTTLRFNTIKALKNKLGQEDAIKKVLTSLAERFMNRNGGYTRIIKTGERDGDKAKTARIELIPGESKETDTEKKKTAKKTPVKERKQNDKK